MKNKVHREVLSRMVSKNLKNMCAPPRSYHILNNQNESLSLCTLAKGSLTVEAALVVPFFLTILLAFFSLFSHYTIAADLKIQAAAEAKQIGSVLGCVQNAENSDVVIYKSGKAEWIWEVPFVAEKRIVEKAVCRPWVGFTELATKEACVYITPEGTVYHLYRDCTHLELSIRSVSAVTVKTQRNQYGEKYRQCKRCKMEFGILVYITEEGDCYHSERTCSGLKRTVRRVAMEEVRDRSCCIRCLSRGE